MIIAYILCIICPPVGGLLMFLIAFCGLSTKSGRAKYVKDSNKYYRNRNAYFKKTYGI
jgi:hypothetical protein